MSSACFRGRRWCRGPHKASSALWGEEEQHSERALATGRGEGYGACDDAAGPVLVYGISASVVYGMILYIAGLF